MFDINREHPEYVAQKAGLEPVPGSVCRRRAVQGERGAVSDPAAERAGRCLRGAADSGFLRELYRVDYRLVHSDAISPGADADVRRANERARQFFSEFIEDCDLKGTNLTEFFRQRYRGALVYGRSHILVDFPRWTAAGEPGGRGCERGSREPTWWVIRLRTSSTGAWTSAGNYEWVVLRTTDFGNPNIEDAEWS